MVLTIREKLIQLEITTNKLKKRNTFLLSQIYTCPYCAKITNLRCIVGQHWKSKACQKMKELYLKDINNTEHKVIININETISEALTNFKDDEIFNDSIAGKMYKYKLEQNDIKYNFK